MKDTLIKIGQDIYDYIEDNIYFIKARWYEKTKGIHLWFRTLNKNNCSCGSGMRKKYLFFDRRWGCDNCEEDFSGYD